MLAMKYNLSLISEYGTRGHDQNATEVDEYFGFGCIFNDAHLPLLNSTIIQTSRDTLETDLNDIDPIEQDTTCFTSQTVLDITKYDNNGNEITRGAMTTCDYRHSYPILRKIFNTTYTLHSRQQHYPRIIHESKSRGDLILVIHVRRGDILENSQFNIRFTNFHSIVKIINNFMKAKTSYEQNHDQPTRPVKIFFITEGSPNNDIIIDVDTNTGKSTQISVKKSLMGICDNNTNSLCSTHVFTDNEITALQSFTVFCESDVLVTSKSGFAHLASMLCPPKLVIAIPFWCPYDIPQDPLNVVKVPASITELVGRISNKTQSDVIIEQKEEKSFYDHILNSLSKVL